MNPRISELNRIRTLTNELSRLALLGDWEALSHQSELAQTLCTELLTIGRNQWSPEDKLIANALITEILQDQAIVTKALAPWLKDVKELLNKLGDSNLPPDLPS